MRVKTAEARSLVRQADGQVRHAVGAVGYWQRVVPRRHRVFPHGVDGYGTAIPLKKLIVLYVSSVRDTIEIAGNAI